MKYGKQTLALLTALLMIAGVLAGCAKEETLTLRVGVIASPTALDPAGISTDGEKILIDHLYENLMKNTNDGKGGAKAVAGQARSYEVAENLDGTETYTFTLRDNIYWSDGQKVTAHDFVYAWQRLVDPATGSPHAEVLSMVAGYVEARARNDLSLLRVSAASDNKLEVTLSYHCPYFISSVCTSPYTMPVRQGTVTADLPTNGAYTITAREEGRLTAQVSNGYYDTRKLGPQELQFVFAPDSVGAMQLYQNGGVDFVWPLPESEMASLAKDNYWKADSYAQVYTVLFNQMSVDVQSEELRRAMLLTVDRLAVAALLGVGAKAAGGLVPSGVRDPADGSDYRTTNGDLLDSNPENYEQNCQQAREALKTAAITDPGSVTLDYRYTKSDINQQVAELLQKTWNKELGLRVKLVPLTEEQLQQSLSNGEFIMAGLSLTAQWDDPTAILSKWTSGNAGNYGFYSNSAYDMLMRVTNASSKAEVRSAYLKDAEGLLLQNAQTIPLYFTTTAFKLRDGLEGVFHDGLGNYYFTGVNRVSK